MRKVKIGASISYEKIQVIFVIAFIYRNRLG